MSKPVVVVGNGWSALGAVGWLARSGIEIHWIHGTSARMLPPLPSLSAGPGADFWRDLGSAYGVECGELTHGSFVREFRNKAFREPAWTQAPTPEQQVDVCAELLWAPERRFVAFPEARFSYPLAEIEEAIRASLKTATLPNLHSLAEIPVAEIEIEDQAVRAVVLSSGVRIECGALIFADNWSQIPQIKGMPKGLGFLRSRQPVGILQARFRHVVPVGQGLLEGFFSSLPKEAGEEIDRHIWGHFSSDGKCSLWTICLAQEESEDNHAIAKKFRKMKSTLDRMFAGSAWVPTEKPEFMTNVESEQVHFEESLIFAGGEAPHAVIGLPKIRGAYFLTDGYGPSEAMSQVASTLRAFGQDFDLAGAERTDPQAKDMNGADPVAP